ncbi:MAG: tetratricopeptide repeat protein [Paludibacteraceae bacterium]|nr:tetratricopeptide repeat protein [Paludibacteraceae bacterium]MBR1480427.1 tetratricopeptide repeat protein [Paludibacteraceae bacterium]
MKPLLSFILMLTLAVSAAHAQTPFEQANTLYANGQYAEAAEAYRAILADTPDADVYYNLGNAAFRQGELAQAILAYERALRLNPAHKDARYNLEFAQQRIIDNIEDNRSFFLSQWAEGLRNSLHERTWIYLSLGLFWLMLVCALLFAFGRSAALRKSAFFIALTALLISVAALCNAASLHHRDTARAEAVITQGVVNAKASPDRSGTDLFTLHEGTEVTILETLGEWCNIRVGNNIGWIQLTNLERI